MNLKRIPTAALTCAIATLLAVAVASPSPATAAPVDLLDQADVRIEGVASGNRNGYSVAAAGDVNGDGRDDVVIGAYGAGTSGRSEAGASYVIYGGASPSSVDLANLTTGQGFRIDGAAASDRSGVSVAGAGDVNGDGRDDVVIGGVDADPSGRDGAGSTWVVYGAPGASNVDLASLANSRGFRVDGAAAGDESGYSVAAAGDLNGDGRDDVAIGAYGTDPSGRNSAGVSYVIYGAASQSNLDLATLTAGRGVAIAGAAAGDQGGFSVAGAGDVNGDGRDDLLIGAPKADAGSRGDSGATYVIYGSASPSNLDLAALTTGRGVRIDGAIGGDDSGYAVAGGSDINADGRDDVVIGANRADPNGRSDAGLTYVIYGSASPSNLDLATLTTGQGLRIDGATAGDRSGIAVAAGGSDINGDGRDDLLIGAHRADPNGRNDAGSSYVIYGSASPANVDLSTLITSQGLRIDGAAAGDNSGTSLAGAGDMNGDGRDDVVVGAWQADPVGRTEAGSSYLVYSSLLPWLTYERTELGQVGVPMTFDPVTRRTTGSASYSASPALPAGLSLNQATGRISGTPSSPGISTHRVTVNDTVGVTASDVRIGVVNAQGPGGPAGGAGPAGPVGGAGPAGPQGATGTLGATGATGARGPAGRNGRDARVTCKVSYSKRGRRARVTCRVTLARVSVTVSRHGKTYARGSGSRTVRLRTTRSLRPGRYTIVARTRAGRRLVSTLLIAR